MNGWSEKRKIMLRYNVAASLYDMRYAEEQRAKFAAAFKHLNMEKLGVVLDVGCGTGLLFEYVADKADAVVGVDVSKRTLRIAKENAKGFSTVSLVLADADNLPLVSGTFTSVFAFTLVQNMPNPAATVREIERNATAGASIVVSALKKVFSREDFEKLLRDAGLQIRALEEKDLKCYVAVCKKTGRV